MPEPQNFDALRDRLVKEHTWPTVYMFKFIAPAENRIFARLFELFPPHAEFQQRNSSSGKYVSVTVKEVMLSSDEVVDIYRKASAIEGVMVL